MSAILVYLGTHDNKLDKSAYEIASYAVALGEKTGLPVMGLVLGNAENIDQIGQYGLSKVMQHNAGFYKDFDATLYAKAVHEAAKQVSAEYVLLSHDYTGKSIAPFLSVYMKAGLVTTAVALPEINGEECIVKRNVFSGKALAYVKIKTPVKIIALLPNAYGKTKKEATVQVEQVSLSVDESVRKVKVKEVKKVSGKVSLTEADIVVSAGRGLKGPENWKMIEELAELLGAATACSRPVADAGWRPHHEHVGQTGTAIRPNLYIAIGISGAIQHLAGVNGSKVIVVINTDPEAPFFKAADYGIVGDAFQVVPKLIESYKQWKSQHA